MSRRFRAWMALVIPCIVGAAIAASPASAKQQASLTGQEFVAVGFAGNTGTSEFQGECDLAGISVYTFRITGSTGGPYPGTFIESGSFTLGPLLPMSDGILVATPLAFASTFTITSAQGTVIGEKRLSDTPLVPYNFGSCGGAGFPGFPDSFQIQLRASYTARIEVDESMYTDRGESFVDYIDLGVRDIPDMSTFQFVEQFTSDQKKAK